MAIGQSVERDRVHSPYVSMAIAFVVVMGLLAATLARGQDDSDREALRGRYFMVVWGYQGPRNAPRESHTFAAFYNGDELAEGNVSPATISWLPVTGVVRLFQVAPGRNLSLAQTLTRACQQGKRIAAWGPYEVTGGLYRRALARIALLESGEIAYQGLGRRPGAMNCIQAVGDITGTAFHPGTSWGFTASEVVVRHLHPFLIAGKQMSKSLANSLMTYKCRR